MAKIDLNEFIVPKILENTDTNGSVNSLFRTEDFIYLDSLDDIADIAEEERICYPTDYAIMNFVMLSDENVGTKNRKSCQGLCRGGLPYCRKVHLRAIGFRGENSFYELPYVTYSFRPALQLNLASVISARSTSRDIFKLGEYIVERKV